MSITGFSVVHTLLAAGDGDDRHHSVAHVGHKGDHVQHPRAHVEARVPAGGGAGHHRAQEPVEQRDARALDQAQHGQALLRDCVRFLHQRGKEIALQHAAYGEDGSVEEMRPLKARLNRTRICTTVYWMNGPSKAL